MLLYIIINPFPSIIYVMLITEANLCTRDGKANHTLHTRTQWATHMSWTQWSVKKIPTNWLLSFFNTCSWRKFGVMKQILLKRNCHISKTKLMGCTSMIQRITFNLPFFVEYYDSRLIASCTQHTYSTSLWRWCWITRADILVPGLFVSVRYTG